VLTTATGVAVDTDPDCTSVGDGGATTNRHRYLRDIGRALDFSDAAVYP
jgi:hypothetical protein